jgi:hypothetical protein
MISPIFEPFEFGCIFGTRNLYADMICIVYLLPIVILSPGHCDWKKDTEKDEKSMWLTSGADPGIEYRGGGATKILTMKEIKHKKTANFISIL